MESSLKKGICIWIRIALKSVPEGAIDHNSLLVHVMAWCLNQWWTVMTSSNGNFVALLVLYEENPLTKDSVAELWCFFYLRLKNGWADHRDADDVRRHHAHYDVTLMPKQCCIVRTTVYASLCLNKLYPSTWMWCTDYITIAVNITVLEL